MASFINFALLSWLLVICFVLLRFCTMSSKRKKRVRRQYPPGPFQLPVIGNLHLLGDLHHRSLLSLSRKHRAPLMYLKLGRVPTVVVSSAQLAEVVMKTHELEFCDRSNYPPEKMLTYNFRDLAYASHGRDWRELRKVCVLELLGSSKVRSFQFLWNELISRMMGSISEVSASVKAVNLTEMLRTFTNDLVCRAAFGKKFRWEDEEEKRRFYGGLHETQMMLGASFVEDGLPWLGWILDVVTGLRRRLKKNFEEMDYFYEKVLKQHEQLDVVPADDEEDFIDVLLRVVEELHLTRDHVKGILMDLLVGGTDSSATTVEWAMAELMRNPSAMKKVQEEIREVLSLVGKKDFKLVEEIHLPHLEYLRLVVKETLRLHPPTPFLIPRENKKHCKINGYDIFPKTRVIINAQAVALDTESWENPEEFRPERFRDMDVDYRGQDFRFLPFGAGRRGCPGLMFAVMTVELALANLLYSFDWEMPCGMRKEELSMEETYESVVQRKIPLVLVPIKFNKVY